VARVPGDVEESRFSDLKNTRLLPCAIRISILKIGFEGDRDVECVLSPKFYFLGFVVAAAPRNFICAIYFWETPSRRYL
jgi:hypothetical protein